MGPRLWVLSAALLALPCAAASTDSDTAVISRGTASLSVADVELRLRGAAPEVRASLVRSADRMEHLLDDMLLQRQLRAEAARFSLEADPMVAAEMQQLLDSYLARKALERLIVEDGEPNFESLARERFLISKGEWTAPASKKVRHVLVSIENRDEAEALKLAEDVRKAVAAGASLADFVLSQSDDPSKINNAGIFEVTEEAAFDPAFKSAALALTPDAPLSNPVRSAFGFHVIEYIDERPQRALSFDEAKPEIVKSLRADWESKRRDAVLGELRSQPSEIFDDGLKQIAEPPR